MRPSRSWTTCPQILTKLGDVLRPARRDPRPHAAERRQRRGRHPDLGRGERGRPRRRGHEHRAQRVVAVIAALVTAIVISVGLAMGQVSLLGWLRRFLPSSTYRDLTELERAIAVSFGGFVRGRLVIGAIYGAIVGIAALAPGHPVRRRSSPSSPGSSCSSRGSGRSSAGSSCRHSRSCSNRRSSCPPRSSASSPRSPSSSSSPSS